MTLVFDKIKVMHKEELFSFSNLLLNIMEVPHINFFVDENSLFGDAKKILPMVRPNWDLSTTEFKVFTEGITNKLLGCFNVDYINDVVLIRVYGKKSDLLIDRKAETKNIKVLHSFGLAPKLYATFNNGLVYEYVPGEILTTVSCHLSETFVLVAQKLADLHSVSADGYVKEPSLWKLIEKFLALVPANFTIKERENNFKGFFQNKSDLEKEYLFLKDQLFNINTPVVFCHNDLLLGNVVYNEEKKSVTFIDYEYADYNYQAYDIANHFNEYAGVEEADYSLFPDEKYQKVWLTVYLKKYNSNKKGCKEAEVSTEEVESLYLDVQKFTLASHYLWGVWCLLQAEYSTIDFDFINYAFVRFQEYFNRKKKIFTQCST